jgi:hypothetical protein
MPSIYDAPCLAASGAANYLFLALFAAIPLILQEMSKQPGHWFAALEAITGISPVPVHSFCGLE